VFGQNFETLLEDRLNRYQRTPKVSFEILNLSVEGYLLTQLVDVAWHHAALFSPDVYLVALTQRSVTRKWTFHVGKLLKEGVDLQYDFLRQVTAQAGVRPTDSLSRMDRKLALFHERVLSWSLAQLQLAAASHKAKLVVLLVPFTVFDPAIDAQFERARLELEAVHVPVVDLRDSFAGETDMRQLRMSRDDFHPNTRGHRLLADNLYRRILADPEVSAAILGSAPAKP
jgi:hypothetical protein